MDSEIEPSESRKRCSPEQIADILQAGERMLRKGMTSFEVCNSLGVSRATFYRWRARYAGLRAGQVAYIRTIESELARMRKLLKDYDDLDAAGAEVA